VTSFSVTAESASTMRLFAMEIPTAPMVPMNRHIAVNIINQPFPFCRPYNNDNGVDSVYLNAIFNTIFNI